MFFKKNKKSIFKNKLLNDFFCLKAEKEKEIKEIDLKIKKITEEEKQDFVVFFNLIANEYREIFLYYRERYGFDDYVNSYKITDALSEFFNKINTVFLLRNNEKKWNYCFEQLFFKEIKSDLNEIKNEVENINVNNFVKNKKYILEILDRIMYYTKKRNNES